MYDTLETNELIQQSFHLNSKIIGINSIHFHEFVDQRHKHLLGNHISLTLGNFFDKNLPSYVALASEKPDVIDDLHSNNIKSGILSINQKLDQKLDASPDSFGERKDVMERISHVFRNTNINSASKIDSNVSFLKNILNHPDKPDVQPGNSLRPLRNLEVEKYNFSEEATGELFKSVLELESNIYRNFNEDKFLFTDDIDEDVMLREVAARDGSEYSRGDKVLVGGEIGLLKNEIGLINAELALRNPANQLIDYGRPPVGASPAIIGDDRNDRTRTMGR